MGGAQKDDGPTVFVENLARCGWYALDMKPALGRGKLDSMNAWQKLRLATAALAELVGALFLATAAYYGLSFITDEGNPLRNEYLFGLGLCLIYSFPPLALAAILAVTLRRLIPKKLFWFLSVPGLFVGLLFLGFFSLRAAQQLSMRG